MAWGRSWSWSRSWNFWSWSWSWSWNYQLKPELELELELKLPELEWSWSWNSGVDPNPAHQSKLYLFCSNFVISRRKLKNHSKEVNQTLQLFLALPWCPIDFEVYRSNVKVTRGKNLANSGLFCRFRIITQVWNHLYQWNLMESF